MTYQYQSDKDLKTKQKTYRIGVYKPAKQTIDSTFKPEVSLKEARLTRDKAKALLSDGIDPTEHKSDDKNNFELKDFFNLLRRVILMKNQRLHLKTSKSCRPI